MWIRTQDKHQADETWVNLDQVTYIEFHHRTGKPCILFHLSDAVNRSIEDPEVIEAVHEWLENKALVKWSTFIVATEEPAPSNV